MNLKERIEALKRLEAAATPGEWTYSDGMGNGPHAFMYDVVCPTEDGEYRVLLAFNHNFPDRIETDARFIAAARNALPDILAAYEAALVALEASHKERDKLRAELEAVKQPKESEGT